MSAAIGLLAGLLLSKCQPIVAAEVEWSLSQRFRVPVVVEKESRERTNGPIGLFVDFGKLLNDAGVKDRFDRDSIHIITRGSNSRAANTKSDSTVDVVIAHAVTGDLPNDDAGGIWWRISDPKQREFWIYFDTLGSDTAGRQPERDGASRRSV